MATLCSFDPTTSSNGGMFHCPECGEMVIGGAGHPDYDFDGESIAVAGTPIITLAEKLMPDVDARNVARAISLSKIGDGLSDDDYLKIEPITNESETFLSIWQSKYEQIVNGRKSRKIKLSIEGDENENE